MATGDERWTRMWGLFEKAAELPPEERDRFLARECGDDHSLRFEVEDLLAHREPAREQFDSGGTSVAGAEPDSDPLIGEQIGPYRVSSLIGQGGMGTVYQAEQLEPVRRTVALKVLQLGMNTREVVLRFESERQALALMDHPHIARVFDGGASKSGRPYFAMELVPGTPITEYCDQQRLRVSARLELFIRVCQAVQHAHQKGIIHRDLKPSNVLVTEQDGRPLPKVIDFGIAKAIDVRLSDESLHTRAGVAIGTPGYMSPEQLAREADIDTRSDVYSLGVLLYELLVGTLPFEVMPAGRQRGSTDAPKPSTRIDRRSEATSEIAERRGTTAEALRRQIRGDLDWIVIRALEPERERRYGSALELATDLERHLSHQPVVAGPPSRLYRARKFIRRHRLGVAATLLLALVATGSGLAIGVQSLRLAGALRTAEARRQEAETQRQEADAQREAAEAVSDYLVGLFDAADPGAGGQVMSVRDLVDRGAERIATELEGQPMARARVLKSLGSVYGNLAVYDRAESLLEESLAILRQGPESVDLVEAVSNLGHFHRLQGDFAKAEKTQREAIEILRRIDPDHLLLAALIRRLGDVATEQGQWDEAESLSREALALQLRTGPENHLRVGESRSQLAFLLYRQSRYDEAIDLLRASLGSWRAVGGERPSWGRDAQEILGSLLLDRGEYQEAELLLQEALELGRKYYGDDHPTVAQSLNNLALLRYRTGEFEAAEPLYLEALAVHRRAKGERSYSLVPQINNLGLVYLEWGDLSKAERSFREAMSIQAEATSEGHPNVAFPLNNLGRTLHRAGRFDEAEAAYRRALSIRRKGLPDGHIQLAGSLLFLGKLLNDRGSPAEGERLLQEGLEIRRQHLAAGDWRIGEAESFLGACRSALQRFEEAEALVVGGWQTLHDARGADFSGTREALDRVVELYETWGRPEEAARYRDRLAAAQRRDSTSN